MNMLYAQDQFHLRLAHYGPFAAVEEGAG